MLWQILIATIKEREDQFLKLKEIIEKQIETYSKNNDVGILFFSDNRQYPVGMKRNILVKNSTAKYLSFVDDDDLISENYVKSIYKAIKEPNIDCVGFKGKILSEDAKELNNKIFIHSINYDSYFEKDGIFYRPPNHLNCIKRDYFIQFPFPFINKGEDTDFAMRLSNSKLLQEEIFIDDILYFYQFEWSKSATQSLEEHK